VRRCSLVTSWHIPLLPPPEAGMNDRLLRMRFIRLLMLMSIVALATRGLWAQGFVNAQLPWHRAVLDSQGKLLAWYHPEENLGYDKVLHLGWDFWNKRCLMIPRPG